LHTCAGRRKRRIVIPGRWHVGFADLPASPESITPAGCGECTVSQLQDLWLWIPGSARYARGPGMTEPVDWFNQLTSMESMV